MCLFKVCFLRSWEILHRISERFPMCVLKMNVHNESLRESSHQRMQLSNCRLRKYFGGVSWWSRSLDFSLPWQEAKVASLIRELRSSMLRAKKYLFNDISNNAHHVFYVSEQHSDCTNISVAQ